MSGPQPGRRPSRRAQERAPQGDGDRFVRAACKLTHAARILPRNWVTWLPSRWLWVSSISIAYFGEKTMAGSLAGTCGGRHALSLT
jgi:hypothetical protein